MKTKAWRFLEIFSHSFWIFTSKKISEREEYFGSRPGRKGIFKWTILRKNIFSFKFCKIMAHFKYPYLGSEKVTKTNFYKLNKFWFKLNFDLNVRSDCHSSFELFSYSFKHLQKYWIWVQKSCKSPKYMI